MTLRILFGILIGGAVGFALGHFGKCVSGACPLTSNPYITAIIGAAIGLTFSLGK